MNENTCPVTGDTHKEEWASFITHSAGLLLSIFGSVILLFNSFQSNDNLFFIGCVIYSISIIALYAASSLYHSCKNVSKKHTLRKIDYICIYLLIAGSYAPLCLGPLKNMGGIELCAAIWICALAGILYQLLSKKRSLIISLSSYLIMGFFVLPFISTVKEEISNDSLNMLVAGGASYTFGVLFFCWDRLTYNHAVWHLFVIGGSTFHYTFIFFLV
jgi:hemolysin III